MFYLLESRGLDPWLVNARDVKHLPGPPEDRPVDRTTGPELGGRGVRGRGGWLGSRAVINDGDLPPRELSELVVPLCGSLEATGDLFVPYRLVDARRRGGRAGGGVLRRVGGVRSAGDDAALVWDGSAALVPVPVGGRGARGIRRPGSRRGTSAGGCRSRSSRSRPHWRYPAGGAAGRAGSGRGEGERGDRQAVTRATGTRRRRRRTARACCAASTTSTWRPGPGRWSTRSRWPGTACPGARTRTTTRWTRSPGSAAGRYRPKVVTRAPRSIPDEKFDALFARLGSHRDRALVAFWVSTGARASELLGATVGDADPGQQLITVIRKGTRALQPLPAAPDAFVWLRLYQAQLSGLVPAGRDEPLWWTLRRPFRRVGL